MLMDVAHAFITAEFAGIVNIIRRIICGDYGSYSPQGSGSKNIHLLRKLLEPSAKGCDIDLFPAEHLDELQSGQRQEQPIKHSTMSGARLQP
jgi:hypothetical protein